MGHMTRSGKLMANLELGNLGGSKGGATLLFSAWALLICACQPPPSLLGEKGRVIPCAPQVGWLIPYNTSPKKKAYAEYLAIISPYSSSSSSSSASFSSLHGLHIAVIIARAFGLYHSKQLCSLPAATGQENV
jgi:hypothetical protein